MLIGCTVTEAPKNSESPKVSAQAPSPAPTESSTPVSLPNPEPVLESAGSLGDYAVDIKDATLTKDYKGNPAIVITYSYTNNGDDAKSAMVALRNVAYQNGVQL